MVVLVGHDIYILKTPSLAYNEVGGCHMSDDWLKTLHLTSWLRSVGNCFITFNLLLHNCFQGTSGDLPFILKFMRRM